MNLYEISTGLMGFAYCRCYAWAETSEEAIRLYDAANKEPIFEIRLLVSGDEGPFITELDDEGFGERSRDPQRVIELRREP